MPKYTGLYLAYSGGEFNTNPNSSLGGGMSFAIGGVVSPQKADQTGGELIPGVSVLASFGNPTGRGWLIYYGVSSTAVWIPFGEVPSYSAAGPGLTMLLTLNMPPSSYPAVSYETGLVEGINYIGTDTAYLLLRVDSDALPTSGTYVSEITIENRINTIFDDVTYVESSTGDVEYRCLWLCSEAVEPISVKISVDPQPTHCVILLASEFLNLDYGVTLKDPEYLQAISDIGYLQIAYPSSGEEDSWEESSLRSSFWWAMKEKPSGYQHTDGVTGDIPLTIASEDDPDGYLSGLLFSDALVWNGFIPSQGKIAFWLRRIKLAEVTPETLETFSLKIEYQGDRVSPAWEESGANANLFVYPPSGWTWGPLEGLFIMDHVASLALEGSDLLLLEDAGGYLAIEDVYYG